MKKKLYMNRTLVLAIVAALILTLMFTMLVACNKNQSISDDVLSLYDILATFDDTTNTLTCREELCYINRESETLTELVFNLSPSAYREGAKFSPFLDSEKAAVYYDDISYGGISIESVNIEGAQLEFTIGGEDENLLIVPISAIATGKSLNIEICFTVTLPKCNGRMGVTNNTVNLGNFYPTLCVFENGAYETHPYYCLGDPFFSDSADYLVTLEMPEAYTAVSSGVVEESYVENGRRTLEINSVKTRDFAAVLSKNFKVVSDRTNGININYCYISDASPQVALATAKRAIEVFSETFGDYPYKVFNVAQTGLNSGGMEYSNLVFINSTLKDAALEETIIHETAHQWWYGVVGGNQIKNAWLDEGLTEFSTAYFFRQTNNPERYSQIMAQTLSNYAAYVDFLKTQNPDVSSDMNRTLADFTTQGEYVIINYHKGALMFASLLDMYGEKKLNKALNTYFNDNSYQIATPQKLIDVLNTYCKGSDSLIQSWLDGTIIIG
ncbi:MAG: M1 family metallopeptidase [Clostridia bacterium]|nr:M1 family metallopeptidase [Clostridia bacterium]